MVIFNDTQTKKHECKTLLDPNNGTYFQTKYRWQNVKTSNTKRPQGIFHIKTKILPVNTFKLCCPKTSQHKY